MGALDALIWIHYPGLARASYVAKRNTVSSPWSLRPGIYIYSYQFLLHAGYNTNICTL